MKERWLVPERIDETAHTPLDRGDGVGEAGARGLQDRARTHSDRGASRRAGAAQTAALPRGAGGR